MISFGLREIKYARFGCPFFSSLRILVLVVESISDTSVVVYTLLCKNRRHLNQTRLICVFSLRVFMLFFPLQISVQFVFYHKCFFGLNNSHSVRKVVVLITWIISELIWQQNKKKFKIKLKKTRIRSIVFFSYQLHVILLPHFLPQNMFRLPHYDNSQFSFCFRAIQPKFQQKM